MAKVTPSINFSTSMFLEILTVEALIRQRMLVPILAFEGTGRTIKSWRRGKKFKGLWGRKWIVGYFLSRSISMRLSTNCPFTVASVFIHAFSNTAL
jgi:hypothetical protein